VPSTTRWRRAIIAMLARTRTPTPPPRTVRATRIYNNPHDTVTRDQCVVTSALGSIVTDR